MKRFKHKRFCLILILLFGFILSSFTQQTAAAIPAALIPDPDAVALNRAQSLTATEFMYYAFRFSGVSRENAQLFVQRYEALASNLSLHYQRNNINLADPFQKGEAILHFMHENLLRRYAGTGTRLDELFDRGVFNCVSSSVVYYALAMQNNLDVRAIRTRGHVFCAVIIDGKIIDVETTNRFGFNPGEKREVITALGNIGIAYVPPGNYRDRVEISAKELLALVLSNRIGELQRRGDCINAVPIAVDRHAVLGTDASLSGMMDVFINHALHLSNRGDSRSAIIFLSQAASVYEHEVLITTANDLFHNRVVLYFSRNQISQARDFYRAFETNPIINSAIKQNVFNQINQKELYFFVHNNRFGPSRAKILEYYVQNFINKTNKNEFLVFVYGRESIRLLNGNDWVNALNIAQQGVQETERDPRMVKHEEDIKHDIGVVFHGRFVNFYNRGDIANAIAAVQEGLRIVPDSELLHAALERLARQ
ncbi:MAG: hypothetical protein FWD87_06945 [Spirochaetaceae bacterium]|nr:hypothetical protein [Spirochaetaceae bacterium]